MPLHRLSEPDIAPPHPFFLAMEMRAFAELGCFMLSRPFLRLLPRGDGHAVLIVPGFVQDDQALAPLRKVLRGLGYHADIWDQGRNFGFSKAGLASLRLQIEELVRKRGGKVSIIGWSLGGIFARELAFETPRHVRMVITLASPFGRNPQASNMRWLHDLVAKDSLDEMDDDMVIRIRGPLPVPSTAIYSRSDGIVAWQTCVEEVANSTNENIEVIGSHSGLGYNVQVMGVIADRLAQPENAWHPMPAVLGQALPMTKW